MTDTTDTAALSDQFESIRDDIEFYEGNQHCIAVPIKLAKALLDQLEAERQRAGTQIADLEKRLRYTEEALIAATDLQSAELKGDQVPVVLVDERQGSGGFCLTQHGLSLNIQHGTELFTAQQNPVVLPKSHYVCGCADRFMSAPEVIAAIEAAGGKVASDHSGDGDDKVGE